jgi:hypothetical protein
MKSLNLLSSCSCLVESQAFSVEEADVVGQKKDKNDDHHWTRQGSNLRPVACKANALPLRHTPRWE